MIRGRFLAQFLAACSGGAVAAAASAQAQPDPPPPQPDTTTISEIPAPEPTAPEQAPPEEIERVPPDASGINLSTLETKNLSLLYFDPVQTYLTPYIARSFENALAWHMKRFEWTPWERTTVLIKDFGDYGNAGARGSPNNTVLFDVAPLSQAMETFTPGERFYTLTNHELAHVATIDVWNRRDAWWRRFFGGKPMPIQKHPESILYNFLVTPRNNAPRWYFEGSAVFFETWMAGGLGRAQGGFDEMVFRAKVRDGDKFYSPLGLESEGTAVDFQVGVNDYLYGTRFFSWLALTYGPDKPVEWLKRGEDSKAFYAAQFRHVFGKKLDDAWDDWIAFEQIFQKANLDRLAKYPLTEVKHLSPKGLGSISHGFVDDKTNSLIAAFRFPGQIGFVGRMDLANGKLTKLSEIKGMMLYKVTSLAYDPTVRKAYYTEDNYAFRDLIEIDVDTGRKRKLLTDARIGDMVVNPRDRSLWGIRHQNGYATIVRIPQPLAGFNQIHTFDYGDIPFDLDISPDGTRIAASFGTVDGKQSVRVWDLATLEGGGGPQEVAKLELPPSTPETFVFTPDGKGLVGTSYYTGASNVFTFDIASGKYDAVSNASTGFFRPMPRPDGSLLVYEYTGEGLTPAIISPQRRDDLGTVDFLGTQVIKAHPVLKEWGVGSPAEVPLDQLITERGKYHATKRMKLAAHYPIVEGYKGSPAFGYYIHFEDPLQFHQLSATLSVSPFGDFERKERLHFNVEYETTKWKLRYWHNGADFYDLFGPIERSRKGDAFLVSYNQAKIYDPPRQLDVFGSAALYLGLEQLPGAQNVLSPKNIGSAEIGVRYTNTRRALGGVDREKGIAWRAMVASDYAEGKAYPRLTGGIDAGTPLPLANSSAWLYAHAGIQGGPRESPLGAYYFGAFQNNYVDDRTEKRYRELESMPGFGINQVAARRFVKLTGEVNLPPVRFAEVGTPAFYLSFVRPALFAGTLLARSPSGDGYRVSNVGGQLDLNFTVAMRLPMVLSLGVARGFGDAGIDGKTEWLASLKIM
jgi:hypothetical protein